jgi:hypothetical protein
MIKSKIEIGKASVTRMTYDDAVLYCFLLNINGKIGWRLPTIEEFDCNENFVWNFNDQTNRNNRWHVIPVRDLKDD